MARIGVQVQAGQERPVIFVTTALPGRRHHIQLFLVSRGARLMTGALAEARHTEEAQRGFLPKL